MTIQQQVLSLLDRLLSDTMLTEKQVDRSLAIIEKIMEFPVSNAIVEQTTDVYRLHLKSYGNHKIQCIKTIRMLTGLGFKEAKDFSEDLPKTFGINLNYEQARKWYNAFIDAGSSCDIKYS